MKPAARPLHAALALTLLAGCASHRDIQPRATLKPPATLGDAPLPSQPGWQAQTAYWTQFGDPQLDALVDEALAGAAGLAVADARIRRAAALTDAAESALLPQLLAGFDSTLQRFSEHGMVSPTYAGKIRTNNRLALDAGIELDLWGKYRRALDGATASHALAELEAVAARNALSASVVRAYLEFDRLQAQQRLVDRQIALRQDAERLQGIRFSIGLEAEIDRNLQQQSLAQLRVERAQLDERLGLQRNLLAALSGQGPARGERLTAPSLRGELDAHLPSVLPSDLLAGRPDLLAGRWRVEAAAADVDVARAQFYPSVNLAAFLGFSAIGLDMLLDPKSRVFGAGPAIRLPIFEAGRLRASLSMKAADYDTAVEQYNASLVEALRDVCDQARGLDGATRQTSLARDTLVAAQRGVDLMETRRSKGLASRLHVLGAQMAVLAQERVQTDLRAHRLDAAAGLLRALGGGFAPAYNPYTLTASAGQP